MCTTYYLLLVVVLNFVFVSKDDIQEIQRMDEDDVVIAPAEINNGESHAAVAFSSKTTGVGGSRSRNDMNHIGSSGSSKSDTRMKSEKVKSSSSKSQGLPPRVTLSSDFLEAGPSKGPSSGTDSKKNIRFVVSYNGQSFTMSLAQCETVDTLKTLVHAHYDIPPCQQIISGWPSSEPSSNSTRFGSLNLPDEVNLQLTTASSNLAGLNILRYSEQCINIFVVISAGGFNPTMYH